VIRVEQVDFVSVPTRDVGRAVAFYSATSSSRRALHRRYAPRRKRDDGES